MLEIVSFKESESSLDNVEIKPLTNITFIGLLNSFDYARALLKELRKEGSIDILKVRKNMVRVKDHLRLLYLEINAILNSYKDGFAIEGGTMKCDFCPDKAFKYKEFHKWCEFCFTKEFGGELER